MPPVIQIYSLIGQPGEANDYSAYSQDRFQADLASMVSQGATVVQLRINSVGGNWLMAQGMFGMIKASALKIDTYCDGIAASSASLLFMAGRKRLIASHARLMIHNCSGGAAGGISDLEKAIEGQRAINESMATVYANATSLPIEQIRDMMAAETWLSADEAVQLGFATAIIDAPKSATPPPADLTASTAQASLLQLQAYYAGHLPASPTSTMKDLLLPILQAHAVANITATATDEQVTAAVTAAFSDLAATRGQVATLTASLTETAGKAAAAETARAEMEQQLQAATQKEADAEKAAGEKAISDLVQGAVAAGKITVDLVPTYTALATANLEAATTALGKLTARKSVIETITATGDAAQLGKITAAGAMAEINANQAKK